MSTPPWVSHFRHRNNALMALMQADLVLTHPMVVAELACGTPPEPRRRTLGDLDLLQRVQQATLTEVRNFIERECLYGLGYGPVDLSLLASTMLMRPAELWTLDKKLGALAVRFGVMHRPVLH